MSLSQSPPPKKFREEEDPLDIWEIVAGKPKNAYATRDIDSDDDDMEADAFALETEERIRSGAISLIQLFGSLFLNFVTDIDMCPLALELR
jgi:hypothetical protein